jgi:hypothetical protein
MVCLGEIVPSQTICSLMSDLQSMSDIHVNYAQLWEEVTLRICVRYGQAWVGRKEMVKVKILKDIYMFPGNNLINILRLLTA